MMKRFFSLILVLALAACAVSCSGNAGGNENGSADTASLAGANGDTVMIEMKIKDFGTVKLELYPDIAPITVENFKKLASEGFYDGLTFHRIFPGFMIQGGDPKGDGTGGSDPIKGEFAANGVENNLSHTRGVISMARKTTGFDTGSCQFFIMHADSTFLDGQYAAFGRVTEGMDVIDAIASVECSYSPTDRANTVPIDPPVIESVRVIEG